MHRIWEARVRAVPVAERDSSGLLLRTLTDLYKLEPEGRGREMVHAYIAAAEVPRLSPTDDNLHHVHAPWCSRVKIVYRYHWGRYHSLKALEFYPESPPEVSDEEAHSWTIRRIESELPGAMKPLTEVCSIAPGGGIPVRSH